MGYTVELLNIYVKNHILCFVKFFAQKLFFLIYEQNTANCTFFVDIGWFFIKIMHRKWEIVAKSGRKQHGNAIRRVCKYAG